jgi:hypothetical protein
MIEGIQPLQPESLVDAAICRPTMYTCHGSLPEVFAFLEGYYSGLCVNARSESSDHAQKYWFEFIGWLRNQFPIPKPNTWQDVILLMEQDEPTSDHLHLKMFRAYREYLTTHGLLRTTNPH